MLAAPAAARIIGAEPAIIAGSGAELVVHALTEAGCQGEAAFQDLLPEARALALMAPHLAPTQPLRPLYLRAPDAKPQAGTSLPRIGP